MTPIRTALLIVSAACLLAQGPTSKPPAPAFTPAVSPDKVVLSVGDLKLTAAQFNYLVDALLPADRRSDARGAGRKQFADQLLIQVMALANEGKRRKLDETQAYKAQKEFQAQDLLARKAFEVIAKVDDADLRKYFNEHTSEFEQVHARHILIRVGSSPDPADPGQKDLTEQEALAKAQEVRKRLAGGADFAAVATEVSDDAGTKGVGGDLGFLHRGQVMLQIEQVAFKLQPDELSEPVRTPLGYHLIKVEARNSGSFDGERADIERRVLPQKQREAVEELVKKETVVLDPDFFGLQPK